MKSNVKYWIQNLMKLYGFLILPHACGKAALPAPSTIAGFIADSCCTALLSKTNLPLSSSRQADFKPGFP